MKRNFWNAVRTELAIWRAGILPGTLVIGLIVATRLMGGLQRLEWTALDQVLRLRPPESTDERIVVVGINEDDIRRIGTYPIPDQDIAALLKRLQTYQPAVIGLDIFRDLPVEPGHGELVQTLREMKNLVAIEKVLPDRSGLTVNPPPSLPAEQVGFADTLFDADGALRRSLLGTSDPQNRYHLALPVQLAAQYLTTQKVSFGNGRRNPQAMRFGDVELPRLQPNTGGYVNLDAGGYQVLLNVRSGPKPFRIISLHDLQSGKVAPATLRNRIILIGVTSPSVKDTVTSGAIDSQSAALIYGIEIQAHAVSQIISAVLDQRPLLQAWSDGWEYIWIIAWGIVGIGLGRLLKAPLKILLGLGVALFSLGGICYGAIILGWWLPLAPAALVLLLNGAGLAAASFYWQEQDLRTRLKERQLIIDQTFNAIHNGPLQTLAWILQQEQDPSLSSQTLFAELRQLNRELRSIYESVQQEALSGEHVFYLSSNHGVNLQAPLHESLYEVFSHVVERDFPCFKTLKVKVVKFEPLDDRHLSEELKRGVCRFLEEALCNAGKHAIGLTRLEVSCLQEQGENVVRVADNGVGLAAKGDTPISEGMGTQQARQLAKQIRGQFSRSFRSPQGTMCELRWPGKKLRLWSF